MSSIFRHRALCALALVLILFSTTFAAPNTVDSSGIYVRDSAVAVEKFALAKRMERLSEWGKAADVYQEMLQTQGDRVIASQTASDGHVSQYQSVITAVQQQLSQWPAEALEVYRGRYETEAAGLLEQAKAENRSNGLDDPALLHKVFSNYFVTDAGKSAGLRLIDSYLENGDFAAAGWTGQRLLDLHPLLADDRPKIIYRTALAHHFAGDDAGANTLETELREKFGTALGQVRGVDVVLADSLADELKKPMVAAASNASNGESWPMAFGSPDRARLPASTGFGGARLFSIPIDDSQPHMVSIPAPAKQELKQSNERDRKVGLMTGIMPVIDHGELFFQDNVHVYAVSLESDQPLPGWRDTYGGDRNGRYTIAGWATPRSQQETICLTDDSLLAVMGQPDMAAAALTGQFLRDTRLVCLDRHTGRERWVSTPQHLPQEAATLRDLDYAGSPLVVGDNVYLLARGGRGMQFEDCYIICLALDTGAYKWSSYLASANTNARMWDMDVASSEGLDISHIAYYGGRLYVSTNVGAVAALDAYDGSVIWLDLYDREAADSDRFLGAQPWPRAQGNDGSDGSRPWSYNPVIVRDGKVFVLPSDGNSLYVYNAADGAPIRQIKMGFKVGSGPVDTTDTLVGIGGENGKWMVLASDRSVYCLDWANYDSAKVIDSLGWYKNFDRGGGGAPNPISGRPFMTADAVFVPTTESLSCLSLRTGATQYLYPAAGNWDEKTEGPGNVLVTQDHLIVAGSQRVSVYTDLSVATHKLDVAIATTPTDPEPHLRYAEILFVAGKLDGAATKLDEAATLLHIAPIATTEPASVDATANFNPANYTPGNLPTSSPRSRLFNDALSFAETLTTNSKGANGTMIDGLFDRAAAAAGTPAEWVTYRLRRAEYARKNNDPPTELALYQSILASEVMRSVTVANGESASSPAGAIARVGIADLLQRDGRAIYAPYEHQAQAALDTANAAPPAATDAAGVQAQRLVNVAEEFPNSIAAHAAMLGAADSYEARGNPRSAAALLRLFCSRYPDSPERAVAVESLARDYLEMPNRLDSLNVAIGRLEQGAKLADQPKLTRPLKLPDGSTLEHVTFTQAADALRKFQAQMAISALPNPRIGSVEARRPKISGDKPAPFLPDDPNAMVTGVSALVDPLKEWARHDRVVTFDPANGLSVFAVGSNKPLFVNASILETPESVAWIGNTLLVWCPSRLVLLHASDTPTSTTAAATTAPATQPGYALGDVIWDAPLHNLPVAQLASVGGHDADADDATPAPDSDADAEQQQPVAQGGVLLNRQRVFINGNGRVVIGRGGQLQIIPGARGGIVINGVVANAPQANGAAAPAGAEKIDHLIPGIDRVVFSTSGHGGGRVISIGLTDGHIQWQTRLEDHTIEQLVANDDFVAVRASSENDIRLIAFDALTGQPVWHPHPFTRENNDADVPVNLALAEDGSLVYLMPDKVCCKDLFDPDPKLRFDRPVMHNNGGSPGNTFVGAIASDQLIVSDGRVLVVSDSGTFVRVYALSDGRPYHRGDAEPLLNTEVTNSPWNVHMRLVGSKLYIFGPQTVIHYDLDLVDDMWNQNVDQTTNASFNVQDLVITRDDSLAVLSPATNAPPPESGGTGTPLLRLRAYSRELLPSGRETAEVRNLDRILSEPSGITQLQVVDGGIYYATGNHKLHFLRGLE